MVSAFTWETRLKMQKSHKCLRISGPSEGTEKWGVKTQKWGGKYQILVKIGPLFTNFTPFLAKVGGGQLTPLPPCFRRPCTKFLIQLPPWFLLLKFDLIRLSFKRSSSFPRELYISMAKRYKSLVTTQKVLPPSSFVNHKIHLKSSSFSVVCMY